MNRPLQSPARRACALLAALLLAGCVTVARAPDPLETAPAANESAVVVSVTGNSAQVAAIDEIELTRVTPADANLTEKYVLRRKVEGLSRDTSLFIGVVPAGEYELTTLRDNSTRQFLNLSATMRRMVGRFAVRDGKPADLGRLVMTPVNTRVVVGRSARVTSNDAILKRFAPDYGRLFAGAATDAWTAPRPDDDRVEEYAMQRPVGFNNPVELADGTIIAGSRLGTVLIRMPGGQWHAARSEGLDSLFGAAPVDRPDARLVAVGEFGTLLRLDPKSNRLLPIDAGDLPPGNLLFVTGNDQAGWYLAHQRGSEVTVFRSPRIEAGQWSALRKASVARSFWTGDASFWIWNTARGLAYATSDGEIHWLDFDGGQWTTTRAPNGHRLLNVAPNPDGSLGILTSPGGGFGGIFAGVYLSKDRGQNWQEIKTEFKVKISPPRQTPSGKMLMVGGVFGDPELQASEDGGATWTRVGPFKLDQNLVLMPSGRMLAVGLGKTGLFDIRASVDEGKTWTTEYSNFDRSAYEAAQKPRKP